MNSAFLVSIFVSASFAAIATIWALKRHVEIKRIIISSVCASILLIPPVGLYLGTWYSHGFDIPWWAFGILNSIVVVLITLIVISIAKLFYRLGNY